MLDVLNSLAQYVGNKDVPEKLIKTLKRLLLETYIDDNKRLQLAIVAAIESLDPHVLQHFSWEVMDVCVHRLGIIISTESEDQEEGGEENKELEQKQENDAKQKEEQQEKHGQEGDREEIGSTSTEIADSIQVEINLIVKLINSCANVEGKHVYLCFMSALSSVEGSAVVHDAVMNGAICVLQREHPNFWLREISMCILRILNSLARMASSNEHSINALELMIEQARYLVEYIKEPFEEYHPSKSRENGVEKGDDDSDASGSDVLDNHNQGQLSSKIEPEKQVSKLQSITTKVGGTPLYSLTYQQRMEGEANVKVAVVDAIIELHRRLVDAHIPISTQKGIVKVLFQLNVNIFSLLALVDAVKSTHEKRIDMLDIQGIQWPPTQCSLTDGAQELVSKLSSLATKGAVYSHDSLGIASLAHSFLSDGSHAFISCLSGSYCLKQFHELASILINRQPTSLGCRKGIEILSFLFSHVQKYQGPVSLLEQFHFNNNQEHQLLEGLQQATVFAESLDDATKRSKMIGQYIDLYNSEGRYSLYSNLFRSIAFDTLHHVVFSKFQSEVKLCIEANCTTLHKTLFSGNHLWGLLDVLTKLNVPKTVDDLKDSIHKVSLTLNLFFFLFSIGGSSLSKRIEANILNHWDSNRLWGMKHEYLSRIKSLVEEASSSLLFTLSSDSKYPQMNIVEKQKEEKALAHLNIASFTREQVESIVDEALNLINSDENDDSSDAT
eukprot:m.52110 g.52110  ORF g.52110 m.52110 type:complete len:726 (-) comp7601_c0_seq1:57-2234(-)